MLITDSSKPMRMVSTTGVNIAFSRFLLGILRCGRTSIPGHWAVLVGVGACKDGPIHKHTSSDQYEWNSIDCRMAAEWRGSSSVLHAMSNNFETLCCCAWVEIPSLSSYNPQIINPVQKATRWIACIEINCK